MPSRNASVIALHDALKRMSVIREGFVVRNLDGSSIDALQDRNSLRLLHRRAQLAQWMIG
jgi:hypothetical protein